MKLSDFDYNLPKELIANSHCEPRDHSRLFVYNRKSGWVRQAHHKQIEHKHFYDIVKYLNEGDVLVFNNSKVFKARIFGVKETPRRFGRDGGGKIEFLVIRNVEKNIWQVLAKGKLKIGDKVLFDNKLEAEVVDKSERTLRVKFNISVEKVFQYLEKFGEMPLPPYVSKNLKSQISNLKQTQNFKLQNDKLFYQTVYAEKVGSVAAPTAGFHFTPALMDKLKKKGVKLLNVTLHVGPGTFLPVETEDITNHKMHEEFFEIDVKTWNDILKAKKEGRRIIAIGTTSCRVLESKARGMKGSTEIFIYPPFDFKIVDALITNFHLPKSTLLMLVSAFLVPGKTGGIKKIKDLYEKAIKKKYRFYSFGDSMFIQ
jgi:S-adenosylmethionine:tRNA ribosyltransferase-isomerase